MINLAVFSSGKGTNTRNICAYFSGHPTINIALIACDRSDAGGFVVAEDFGIPSLYLSKQIRDQPLELLQILNDFNIDYLILAGYLRLIPSELIQAFPQAILNIHPALLPNFGGKGMYGMHVHHAVYAAGINKTGISIHLVDENYDEGKIIFQKEIELRPNDSPERIAEKVHQLEMEFYPTIIEQFVSDIKSHNID
jgi:phosphoribosylglycinamide formyltransferase-1